MSEDTQLNDLKQKYPIFIGIHIGAGYHSQKLSIGYRESIKNALNKTFSMVYDRLSIDIQSNVIPESIDSLWVLESVISILEDDPLTNSGVGSNLNIDGEVECDASTMDGQLLCRCNNQCFSSLLKRQSDQSINSICGGGIWAGVGASIGISNPIKVTSEMVRKQRKGLLSLGRQRPMMLVGQGAREWAESHRLPVYEKNPVIGDPLITQQANIRYLNHKARLDTFKYSKHQSTEYQEKHQQQWLNTDNTMKIDDNDNDEDLLNDTVGAIVVDWNGNITSGVSSGGISLKHKGRVGEAAIFGAGCWAQNEILVRDIKSQTDKLVTLVPGVACSSTGVGEQLMKSQVSKECCLKIIKKKYADTGVKSFFEESFLSHSDCFSYLNEYISNQQPQPVNNSKCNSNNNVNNIDEDIEDEEEEEEVEYTDNYNNNYTGESRLGGLIAIKKTTSDNNMNIEFVWGHTTDSMGVGYISSVDSKPRSMISRIYPSSKSKAGHCLEFSARNIVLPIPKK
ncbi:putative asparaginase 2 [Tieghemostelium lacteum]|uniref:Putative asparaginase 2 n=1 Tax=Tieghemostelium lacteum TaxID=361077 RepID=A0A151Z396_TIELA|nr:putative asparaginase 2 [Tieghemostelium lacteum]|eukprot:KYQ88294.1 putative asparaginase 2 [Tieghemostelium lacteum]